MTTTISFSTLDGGLNSFSSSYATAKAGSGTVDANTTDATIPYGQNFTGGLYSCLEAFFSFAHTTDANVVYVAAYIDFFQESTTGTGISRDLGLREYDWSTTLTSADWRTPSQIAALTRYGLISNSPEDASAKHLFVVEENLMTRLETNGPFRCVVYSSRFSTEIAPSEAEYSRIRGNEASGTSTDPALVYTTVPVHTLVRVGAAQVQLSDGRHAYLEADTGGANPVVALKVNDGVGASGTVTTIDSDCLAAEGFGVGLGQGHRGMQSVALARDASNNLYVVSHTNSAGNTLSALAYKKTGASTWTKQTRRSASMPAHNGVINNVVTAWHGTPPSYGTLLAVGSHEPDDPKVSATGETFYALFNCDYLLNGVGTVLYGSGDAWGVLFSTAGSSTKYNNMLNETGSELDIIATDDSSLRGVVVSQARVEELGDYQPVSVVRYVLNSSGGSFADVDGGSSFNIDLWSTKDAHAKVRVLPITETSFAIITVDRDTGWGPTIRVVQNFGTNSTFYELGSVFLGSEGITSLPSPATLAPTFLWDALYDVTTNKIWFYYFDTANSRRLMRTSIDLNTHQAVRDEFQVNATVGATGDTNHAIRVHRGRTYKGQALVAVANKTSGGTQSTIYVLDTLNVAPNAPVLVPEANFNASSGQLFEWTFSDPNAGDTQSAYEFEVDNADTQASVIDTGKVVSSTPNRNVTGGTLTNGVNYRWRVRTWDALDVVGPFSAYSFFTTSASGTVNITNPASDNPPGIVSDTFLVQWSVSGTTQQDYKVRVIRTSNSSVLSDSGWVTSAAVEHQISGMLTEVEYRIEVTVRNAALVETNTATRLLTVNFSSPEIPEVTVTPVPTGGYIEISVVNPTPGTLSPPVLEGFESGVSNYAASTSATLAQDATQFHAGANSAKLTVTGSPTSVNFRQVNAAAVAVLAGRRYRTRFWAYSPSGGHSNLGAVLDWYSGADTGSLVSINSSVGATAAIASAVWEQREAIATSPLTATFAKFGPTLASSPPNGEILNVDELELLEESDQPNVVTNYIDRREAGEVDWTTIATIGPNTNYRDYSAASGVAYEYRVRGSSV